MGASIQFVGGTRLQSVYISGEGYSPQKRRFTFPFIPFSVDGELGSIFSTAQGEEVGATPPWWWGKL